MSTVEQIESAILQLSPQDLDRLKEWLSELDQQRWDEQIERDAAAGKLDRLIAEAEADILAGRVKPLDEVLNNS